jgi:hypothetical protein
MRKGMNGLAMLVEENVSEKYDKEGLFVFRVKRGRLYKDIMVGWTRILPIL